MFGNVGISSGSVEPEYPVCGVELDVDILIEKIYVADCEGLRSIHEQSDCVVIQRDRRGVREAEADNI